MSDIIGRGAEAIIYKDKDMAIKDRISKSYRHKIIDNNLRKFRTRREAKILTKLKEIGFPSPELKSSSDKDMKINMQFIEGDKLRDVLENKPEEYSKEIGKLLAILHENNIIHSDLTTSNMIVNKHIYFIDAEKSKISGVTKKNSIFFIDFGLSFFSEKPEDKAVDLHLLDRALESRHHKIHKKCMKIILESYKNNYKDSNLVLERLKQVQERGRNKHK